MLRAGLLVVVTVAGCKSCDAEVMGQTWVSPDHTVFAYVQGAGVVAVHGELRVRHEVGTGCLTELPQQLIISNRGLQAIAVARHIAGHGWHNRTSELTMSCVLDLVVGGSRPLAEVFPNLTIGHGMSGLDEHSFGAQTGWLYQQKTRGGLDVYDGQGVGHAVDQGRCDVVETVGAIVAACIRDGAVSRRPEGPPILYTLEVKEFDPRAFPPVMRGSRTLEVSALADSVKLSGDGARLAWWSSPLHSVGAVVDVASLRPIAPLDNTGVERADFNRDASQIVILKGVGKDWSVVRFEINPSALVKREQFEIRDAESMAYACPGCGLTWLANGQVIVHGASTSELRTPAD